MKEKAFIFFIDENSEVLTVENIKFAIEGCYPQIKIAEILETEIIYDDPFENLKNSSKKLDNSLQKLKDAFKNAINKQGDNNE
jgi:hypothetical protein